MYEKSIKSGYINFILKKRSETDKTIDGDTNRSIRSNAVSQSKPLKSHMKSSEILHSSDDGKLSNHLPYMYICNVLLKRKQISNRVRHRSIALEPNGQRQDWRQYFYQNFHIKDQLTRKISKYLQ